MAVGLLCLTVKLKVIDSGSTAAHTLLGFAASLSWSEKWETWI